MVWRGVSWAFLGLGSNIEDRLEYLQSAVDALQAHPRIRVDAVSSVYETDPVGGPEQEAYLNMVVRVATLLSPRQLLKVAHDIEDGLGRVRTERWGPRTMDVDILLYDHRAIRRRTLEIPHPRLTERPFALVPLLEVAPGMKLPDGQSIASTLGALAPIQGVTMVGSQVTMPRGEVQ
jgi:2-amino-4-hydroxy-6-hydroxymethyldihydropteridine diphosphokinase